MSSTILIVDDSRTMRAMVRVALEESRHQVVEAADGHAALAVLAEAPADLVITDINMPEMDGLSLVRKLRADGRHRGTPILILTTETSNAVKQTGREAGATGWIIKPFHPEQLRQAVLHVLQQTRS